MDSVNVRNLEQIREHDPGSARSRLGTLIIASLGGAAVVAAVVVVSGRGGASQISPQDPLAQLAARQRTASVPATRLDSRNVNFQNVLSDSDKPTVALAAVKDEHGRLVAPGAQTPSDSAAPEGAEKIPGGPLPAADLLKVASVSNQPRDQLSKLAAAAVQVDDDAELAKEGHDGGIQIQVASFRTVEDADALVRDLRHKGHHAYRQPAYVLDRGLWQRVRIGPFQSRVEALTYRGKLEQTERILSFVIDPDRKRRRAADRESTLSSREKNTSHPGT
jgi:DedD protein